MVEGGLRGRKGSSFGEADNKTIKHERTLTLCAQPLNLAKKISDAHANHAEEGRKWWENGFDVCPKMTKAIGQARTDSNQISFSNVKVSPDRLAAIVPSSTNDGSTTRVTFAKVCESYDACEFMCMARTCTPCKHIVRACGVAKIDVKTLLQRWCGCCKPLCRIWQLHARLFLSSRAHCKNA